MILKNLKKILKILYVTLISSSCSNMALVNSKGQIGIEEYSLVKTAFYVMLCIIIPVLIMTIFFTIQYRASNKTATYNPNWTHSNIIESIIWLIPVLIIIFLGHLTWKSTHLLDPSKEINSNTRPITIEVIALDWKWLFLYPEKGIATINEIAFPQKTPIIFNITSDSVMNSFFIPQLGGQIYAMAGMCSKLNLIANTPGKYKGFSSNFSGKGFSNMKFNAIATKDKHDFNQWIQTVKNSPHHLDMNYEYKTIKSPSIYNNIKYFSTVQPNLFNDIINQYNYTSILKNNQ